MNQVKNFEMIFFFGAMYFLKIFILIQYAILSVIKYPFICINKIVAVKCSAKFQNVVQLSQITVHS